jgi:hypothetical protein
MFDSLKYRFAMNVMVGIAIAIQFARKSTAQDSNSAVSSHSGQTNKTSLQTKRKFYLCSVRISTGVGGKIYLNKELEDTKRFTFIVGYQI